MTVTVAVAAALSMVPSLTVTVDRARQIVPPAVGSSLLLSNRID
jgi:hypothetical protein